MGRLAQEPIVLGAATRQHDLQPANNLVSLPKISSGLALTRSANLVVLAFLAPDIGEAIAGGTRPVDLTAKMLIRRIDLPTAWQDQRLALGCR